MTKQGFLGALDQYWSVEPKPLERGNSWGYENYPQPLALNVSLLVGVTATILVVAISCLRVVL